MKFHQTWVPCRTRRRWLVGYWCGYWILKVKLKSWNLLHDGNRWQRNRAGNWHSHQMTLDLFKSWWWNWPIKVAQERDTFTTLSTVNNYCHLKSTRYYLEFCFLTNRWHRRLVSWIFEAWISYDYTIYLRYTKVQRFIYKDLKADLTIYLLCTRWDSTQPYSYCQKTASSIPCNEREWQKRTQ